MRLISLNHHPDWKNVFCELSHRVLGPAHQAYALKSAYVDQILKLDFCVPAEAFLMEDHTGEFFGRILLQGSVIDKKMGHFGLFCLSNQPRHLEGFKALWPTIEEWFHSKGINRIVGPYLYSTFFPYRFRTDTHPERFSWEPNQPAHEAQLFQTLGFSTYQTYFTNVIEGYGVFATKGSKELEESAKLGFSMRELDRAKIDEEVKIIYDLSMQGFTDNYLFAPIPFELFKSIYVPSFQALDLRTSCLQFDPHGKPIGFNFTFVMDGQIVIKSVCVLPQYRGKGLLNAGIRYTMLKCMEYYPDVKKVATALIHEDNGPSKHVANLTHDRSRHEYVLLSKDLR
jgi:hypothetical protein